MKSDLLKLNLGCGSQVVKNWVNVDYALGARLAKIPFFKFLNKKLNLFDMNWDSRVFIHNLSKVFPWNDNTVDIIYSSHTLEHFTRDDGRNFLSQCHRVLRKGGLIRIVVPDLKHYIDDYLEGGTPADDFIENMDVLYRKYNSKLKNRLASFIQFPHKCMYDSQRLLEILKSEGFEVVTRGPFESEIEDIKNIELEDRTEYAVIVEGKKK